MHARDQIADIIQTKTDLLKMIQVRKAERNQKEELLDSWCPSNRQCALLIYGAFSDQDLQEEISFLDGMLNQYTETISLQDLAHLVSGTIEKSEVLVDEPLKKQKMKNQDAIVEIRVWIIILVTVALVVWMACNVSGWMRTMDDRIKKAKTYENTAR